MLKRNFIFYFEFIFTYIIKLENMHRLVTLINRAPACPADSAAHVWFKFLPLQLPLHNAFVAVHICVAWGHWSSGVNG